MNDIPKIPAVLTVAGSDSGGGAGIQADVRTFSAFKVYGCSVITAVTSQNPAEVRRVDVLPGAAVKCQLETVLDAFMLRFAKTGMLACREIIECVAETAAARQLDLVVDPVMVSTSGTRLLEESAVSAMKEQLFPLAKWITPNIPEAELICGRKIDSSAALADAAEMIYDKYGCNVLLKSGHLLTADTVSDMVCVDGNLFTLSSPRVMVQGNASHGTGCTLSAALTANFALGANWEDSLIKSKAFVYGSLAERVSPGGTVCQMFPPERSYTGQISLNAYKKQFRGAL